MTIAEKAPKEEQAYALPPPQTLAEALDLPLLDAAGNKLTFRALLDHTATERHLIVFIRHFYCGMCENYVRMLAAQLPPDVLADARPPTKLSIVGCGVPACIASYRERTSARFDVYTDPTRALHLKLGMTASLEMGARKPDYIQQSTAGIVLSGVVNTVRSGTLGITLQGGHPSQNGGEWLWQRQEQEQEQQQQWDLKWCKRMRHTRDHAEVAELREVLGMESAG